MRIGRAFAMALAADGLFVFVHHTARPRPRAKLWRRSSPRRQGQGREGRSFPPGRPRRWWCRCQAKGVRLTCLVNSARCSSSIAPRWPRRPARSPHGGELRARCSFRRRWRGSCRERDRPDRERARPEAVQSHPDFLTYNAAQNRPAGLTTLLAQSFAPRLRVAGIAPG